MECSDPLASKKQETSRASEKLGGEIPSAPGQAFESNYGFNTYMVAECTQVEADVSIWW